MFFMGDTFQGQKQVDDKDRKLQMKRLARKFIKARVKDDASKMREAGFQLIPLFKGHEIDEIRNLFRETEREVGYK